MGSPQLRTSPRQTSPTKGTAFVSNPVLRDEALFVMVSLSSFPEAEHKEARFILSSLPPFLFLLLFNCQRLSFSRRKVSSGNTVATTSRLECSGEKLLFKAEALACKHHRLPQRPAPVWAAPTAKPDAQDLTCKQRLCLFTQDRVFTACAYTQTPCLSSQMIICGSRCLCVHGFSFHTPEIVRVDLGH